MSTVPFNISYVDGSGSIGEYFTDDFSIGEVKVAGLQMGLATQTSAGTGVMGIGYSVDEAANQVYPNLIDQLVRQQMINTKAYSLWLNDLGEFCAKEDKGKKACSVANLSLRI